MALTISVAIVCIVVFYRHCGAASFPVLNVASNTFYLLVMYWVVGEVDLVTGAQARPEEGYFLSVIAYQLFYLIGVWLAAPTAFKPLSAVNARASARAIDTPGGGVTMLGILIVGVVLTSYSLVTRNVFDVNGRLLFTIVGFDLLLVWYLMGRERRSSVMNVLAFVAILLVFVYAGFRYRMAVLLLAEILCAGTISFRPLKAILGGVALLVSAMVLAGFGQIRRYGTFSITDLMQLEFSPAAFLRSSGEQTVTFATINIVEGIDRLQLVGWEPLAVLLTHFIPAELYPDKPRTTYLGAYNVVTEGLNGTGAAMHDLGQAALMFGLDGLPFAALALGGISGCALRLCLSNSPSRYFYVGVLVLFAGLLPSRGYLAQQMTWALSFALPAVIVSIAAGLWPIRTSRHVRQD